MCEIVLPLVIGVAPKNKDAFEIYKNDFIQIEADKRKGFYFPAGDFSASELKDYDSILSGEHIKYEFYMFNPDSILPKLNLFLLECINIFETLDNDKYFIRNYEHAFYGDGFYRENELEALEETKNKLLTTQFLKPADLLMLNSFGETDYASNPTFLTSYDTRGLKSTGNSKGTILPFDVFEYVEITYFIESKEMTIPALIAILDILTHTTNKLSDKYWYAKYLCIT